MQRSRFRKLIAVILSAVFIFLTFATSIVVTSAVQSFGDVDNDGKINSSDALIVLQVSVKKKEKKEDIFLYGDVDVNGKLNSTDALLILQKSVGEEIAVTDFSLNVQDKTVSTGTTLKLEAFDFIPKIASNITVEWLSSDTTVATVDSKGTVKTVKPGKVKITAKTTDGSKIEKSVNITVAPVISSVKVDKTQITLEQGSKYSQKLTFAPNDVINKAMTWSSSNTDIAVVDKNGVIKAERIGTATITGTTTDGTKKTVSCKVTVVAMKIPYVNQMPKYPTGCEAASCCMLLKYYGYKITLDEMIGLIPRKNLYKKNGKTYGPDINEMFVGNPQSTYTSANPGYGVFSPAVTKALQKAIDERGGGYTAVKISGCTFQQLLKYIKDGSPAIVWATYKMQKPKTVNAWYIESTGKYFEYPRGTHVMILSGYSPTSVTTVDPYNNGDITFGMGKFKEKWELLGQQAIVLVKNK